jgi:hypothetical protein
MEYGALFALLAVMVCSSCPAVAGEPERPEWVRFGTCAAPGDAACAGWPEDEKSIRSVKNGWDTFMYSIVYQPETGSSFGYFRKIRSGTLHFSVVTGKPSYEDGVMPVRVVMQGNNPLAVIYQSWHYGAYSIGVLDGRSYSEFALGTREPVFEDLDGDGMYETMAHKYIELSWATGVMEPISEFSHMVDGPLLAIYRYTPDFVRVKGKGFEKYFVAHAKELIEGKYLKWLEKGKASGMTEKVRKQLDYIVQNWLATIESTQDPVIIKDALKKLGNLPYPSTLAKKGTIERLVRQGYPMLKQ